LKKQKNGLVLFEAKSELMWWDGKQEAQVDTCASMSVVGWKTRGTSRYLRQ